MAAVSVIVPARDAEATVARTLEALARQELDAPYEVILVDDGSADRTAELARAAPGPVAVVQQEPLGPGAARNRGVREASAAALAFCDADCYPTTEWLRAGLGGLGHADIVQGRVLPDPSTPPGPFDRSLLVTEEAGMYETANLFVRREAFDLVGGFEDWLQPEVGIGMFEDSLFAWRARRAGATTAFRHDAVVHHAVFRRRPAEYVAERRRLRHFPVVAARIPELRGRFFYRGVFLNRRSAAFDAAVAGVLAARGVRSPLPLLAVVPYARMAARRGKAAPVDLAADLVGLASLARGSLECRSPLL